MVDEHLQSFSFRKQKPPCCPLMTISLLCPWYFAKKYAILVLLFLHLSTVLSYLAYILRDEISSGDGFARPQSPSLAALAARVLAEHEQRHLSASLKLKKVFHEYLANRVVRWWVVAGNTFEASNLSIFVWTEIRAIGQIGPDASAAFSRLILINETMMVCLNRPFSPVAPSAGSSCWCPSRPCRRFRCTRTRPCTPRSHCTRSPVSSARPVNCRKFY